MVGPLVIIGCGKDKASHGCAAEKLYTGQHFRACLAAARAMVDDSSIRILSAKYGLLTLDAMVEPYDLTMGEPGSVTIATVAQQSAQQGLRGREVIALCPARYAAVIRLVWPWVETPLAGLGIGRQRHALAGLRHHGPARV